MLPVFFDTDQSLCQPDEWPADVDDMAALYDRQLTAVLVQLIPLREVTRRPRPSDPWFDAECRAAKHQTRRLERIGVSAYRVSAPRSCGITRFVDATVRRHRASRSRQVGVV